MSFASASLSFFQRGLYFFVRILYSRFRVFLLFFSPLLFLYCVRVTFTSGCGGALLLLLFRSFFYLLFSFAFLVFLETFVCVFWMVFSWSGGLAGHSPSLGVILLIFWWFWGFFDNLGRSRPWVLFKGSKEEEAWHVDHATIQTSLMAGVIISGLGVVTARFAGLCHRGERWHGNHSCEIFSSRLLLTCHRWHGAPSRIILFREISWRGTGCQKAVITQKGWRGTICSYAVISREDDVALVIAVP